MSEVTPPVGHKIALDCMGGDLGPAEAVAAAALAIREGIVGPDDTLILVGHEDNLRLLAMDNRIAAAQLATVLLAVVAVLVVSRMDCLAVATSWCALHSIGLTRALTMWCLANPRTCPIWTLRFVSLSHTYAILIPC